MIKRITYIAPHKTALTMSLVFAASSLLFILPMVLSLVIMPAPVQNGQEYDITPFVIMVAVMPVFYFIFGYLFTALAAWLYNGISRFTGGIRYETCEESYDEPETGS